LEGKVFDKLNFTEIIRYFFSGLIVTSRVMFANGVDVIDWAKRNQWAADFSPGIAADNNQSLADIANLSRGLPQACGKVGSRLTRELCL
jgi:hypothetical protein